MPWRNPFVHLKPVLWFGFMNRKVFAFLMFAFPDCFECSVVKMLRIGVFPDHALRIPRFFRFVIQPVVEPLKTCIEDYILQYNTVRPHMALGYETPAAVFAANFSASA